MSKDRVPVERIYVGFPPFPDKDSNDHHAYYVIDTDGNYLGPFCRKDARDLQQKILQEICPVETTSPKEDVTEGITYDEYETFPDMSDAFKLVKGKSWPRDDPEIDLQKYYGSHSPRFKSNNEIYADSRQKCSIPGYKDDYRMDYLGEGLSILDRVLRDLGLNRELYYIDNSLYRFDKPLTKYDKPIALYKDFQFDPGHVWPERRKDIAVIYSTNQFPGDVVENMVQKIRDIVSWQNRAPTEDEVYNIVRTVLNLE